MKKENQTKNDAQDVNEKEVSPQEEKSSSVKTSKKTKKNQSSKDDKKVFKIVKKDKKEIIKDHQVHSKDSGSSQIQVAILTEKIKSLTHHLKLHPKDDHSRRGLLLMVGKRRKLLNFLKIKSKDLYKKLIEKLQIRH